MLVSCMFRLDLQKSWNRNININNDSNINYIVNLKFDCLQEYMFAPSVQTHYFQVDLNMHTPRLGQPSQKPSTRTV